MRAHAVIALLSIAALAAAAPAQAGDQRKRGRLICQTVKDTGSRLTRTSVCLTRQQWREQREADRDNVDRGQTKSFSTRT
jgi:Flp pilus assembly protein TadB